LTWHKIEQIGLGKLGLSPDELGQMEPREFINKLTGFMEQEQERRLWHAWVIASNNPYIKEKPGNFKQFCDKMTRAFEPVKMKPETFLKIIGAE